MNIQTTSNPTTETANDDEFLLNELDTSWIHNFEKEDGIYKDYYSENLYFINIYFVYLNESNVIEKVKKDKFFFNEKHSNTLPKEELFKIIVKNKEINNEKYKLNFLFKYNYTNESHNLLNLLQNKVPIVEDYEETNSYLSTITSIENVVFKKTITMFQDLNSITIIYKKSYNVLLHNNNNNNNNKTKKLHIKNKYKKTTRLYN